MLQDDAIHRILMRAMEEEFSRARPATRHFFEHQRSTEGNPRPVVIHHWAYANVSPYDTEQTLHHVAVRAVREVARTSDRLTGEVAFQRLNWLPHQPLWEDELPLFGPPGEDRFGVSGGNTISSIGDPVRDLQAAAQRLEVLDGEYEGDERLLVFCAKPLEKTLIRAAARAGVPCRVFGIYHYKDEPSWVITRDLSPCSLLIGKPSFDLPVEGTKVVVGARFVVWLNDPRYAVCVTP